MADKVALGKPLPASELKRILDELTTPEKIKETIEKANKRWRKVVEFEIKTILETTEAEA
jgi:hypothetical protein